MLKKPLVIIILLVLAVALFAYYQSQLPEEGVISMGGNEELIAWISLGGSALSLIAAVIGLVQVIIQGRNQQK